MAVDPLVLGRPSSAAEKEPRLAAHGDASEALYRSAGGSTEWCTLRAASVAGVRHRLAGEPSEDSYAWSAGEERLALAVTDGLGSVDGSRQAATAAARTAVEVAVGDADDPVVAGIRAANQACTGGGATTLVLAVVERDGRVEVARVGDSTVLLVQSDGATWKDLFRPAADDDETVDVSTAALPADDPQTERTSLNLTPGEVLVLASDGIGDPWRDGPTTVAPAFAALVAARPAPLELARMADFSRQGCHDDRTIVLLWL